jgi:hypothetical protein
MLTKKTIAGVIVVAGIIGLSDLFVDEISPKDLTVTAMGRRASGSIFTPSSRGPFRIPWMCYPSEPVTPIGQGGPTYGRAGPAHAWLRGMACPGRPSRGLPGRSFPRRDLGRRHGGGLRQGGNISRSIPNRGLGRGFGMGSWATARRIGLVPEDFDGKIRYVLGFRKARPSASPNPTQQENPRQ